MLPLEEISHVKLLSSNRRGWMPLRYVAIVPVTETEYCESAWRTCAPKRYELRIEMSLGLARRLMRMDVAKFTECVIAQEDRSWITVPLINGSAITHESIRLRSSRLHSKSGTPIRRGPSMWFRAEIVGGVTTTWALA
jgi:hypothetical protein